MIKVTDYNDVHTEARPVVVYGVTTGGKIIYQSLKKLGIEVLFFCDRRKKGTVFCGLNVVDPEELKHVPNAVIIIAQTRSFYSACQTLESLDLLNTVCEATALLKTTTASDFILDEGEIIEAENFLKKYPTYATIQDDKIILPTLEIFITEKCTLKCAKCSHLIPEYHNPEHHSFASIRTALERLFAAVASVQDFVILGGEPLLHPELSDFLKWCVGREEIGTITILTNGTIMPSSEMLDALIQTQCRLRISDYGPLSKQKDTLQVLCEELSIPCYINHDEWIDLGAGKKHNYSDEKLKQVFRDCPFSLEFLLLKGKLYRCAHGAHMYNLGIIDAYESDCIDLIGGSPSSQEVEHMLKEYLKISYMNACNYCNGTNPNYAELPAKQV